MESSSPRRQEIRKNDGEGVQAGSRGSQMPKGQASLLQIWQKKGEKLPISAVVGEGAHSVPVKFDLSVCEVAAERNVTGNPPINS
jgi:hypothetical protein